MDIRLNAKLSAYGRIPSPKAGCDADLVTKEDIDSLFGKSVEVVEPTIINTAVNNTNAVSFSDIDSLFAKRGE